MDAVTFVPLGRVARTHGLKGEVSVIPAGLPFVLPEGLPVRFVPPRAGVGETTVEWVRPGPKGPLVKLAGIDGVDAAARVVGATLVCASPDAPRFATEADAAFDPVGLAVFDEERGELGVVEDVIVTGANDVWVVRGARFREVLVPVIEDVVLAVNADARRADVRLLPGLIEGE
jgi:16S rRNA processing protein RimM